MHQIPDFLKSLVEVLSADQVDKNLVAERMSSIDVSKEALKQLVKWDERIYTRNVIERNEQFEIALLCWEPGQGTRIHDHNNYDSWITVLDGTLIEKRFVHIESSIALIPVNETILEKGKVCYINDDIGAHSFVNNSEKRVISLHVYGGYIERCRVYDPKSAKFKYVKVSAGNLSAR